MTQTMYFQLCLFSGQIASLLIGVASHWHALSSLTGMALKMRWVVEARREQDPFTAFTSCQHLVFIKSHCGVEVVVSPESDFKSNDVLSALLFCKTNELSLCNEKE